MVQTGFRLPLRLSKGVHGWGWDDSSWGESLELGALRVFSLAVDDRRGWSRLVNPSAAEFLEIWRSREGELNFGKLLCVNELFAFAHTFRF
jgi:hypothetical protein